MKKDIAILMLLLIGFAASFWTCPGAIVAPKRLGTLVNSADAIVVGTILNGGTTAGTSVITIDVERVLKGAVAAGNVTEARWTAPSASPELNWPVQRDRGMFFLQQQGSVWEIIPAMHGSMLDLGSTFFTLPSQSNPSRGQSILENVWLELAAGLEAGGGRPGAAVIDLASASRDVFTPNVRSVLERFATSGSPRLKRIGQGALLMTGDLASLARFEQEQALLDGAVLQDSINALQFHFQNAGPQSIAILSRLATTESVRGNVRLAAAAALARFHTKETLPPLAQLLGSPDLMLRTAAVGGFSRFANNVPNGASSPAPGEWKYRTDDTIAHSTMDPGAIGRDSRFVEFWKSWWMRYRNELEQ